MSIRSLCRKRILQEMIQRCTANIGYVVMVVDAQTLRILSSCCTVYDVLEEGVTVIEHLSKKRQPLPRMEAIYFITPELSSVEQLVRDFSRDSAPQYEAAHVYWSFALDENSPAMALLAESPTLVQKIKSFVNFNLNFIAYEHRIFHFGSTLSISKIFLQKKNTEMQIIVDKLTCLLASLGVRPSIRYYSNTFGYCESVATLLNTRLKNSKMQISTRSEQTTLLILDRSIDVATLFLHDYKYQALLYDILEIPCCSYTDNQVPDDTVEYTYTTNQNREEERQALICEDDELWVRFRHQFIETVNNEVRKEIQAFAKENSTARIRHGKTLSADETLQAIRAVPQFQEMLSKFWMHVTISERCNVIMKKKFINRVAAMEQDIACGVDKDGNEVNMSKLQYSLNNLLTDPTIGNQEKARLLLLFDMMVEGMTESDIKRLLDSSQLSLDYQRAVSRLLGLNLHHMNRPPIHTGGKIHHCLERNKDRMKFFRQRAKSETGNFARYEPYIKTIMTQFANGTLHQGHFPYVEEPLRGKSKDADDLLNNRASGASFGGRSTNWDWNAKGNPSSINANKYSNSGRKTLIIFVIGGVTMPEMSCAYDASHELNIEVYMGGNGILTPPSLFNVFREDPTTYNR